MTLSKEELLEQVRVRYVSSPDFNGLHVRDEAVEEVRAAAIELVQNGCVQVVSQADYLNPHIRPWASRRSVQDQVDDLITLTEDDYGLCLYPTALGMKGVRLPRRFAARPFKQAMARGRGTLEPAYFSVDVLEQYRNDGRYHFRISDFGADMSIGDEAFEDDSEPEQDKVYLNHIGFAYDLRAFDINDELSPIVRRVVVFHCDLVKLTPEHQQRWKTYQVPDEGLEPHPEWWKSQMGGWVDGVGPFDRFFIELHDINELSLRALGDPVFAHTYPPSDFGWILRPSQREWDDFILQLDKMLSENLRHSFFDAMHIPNKDGDDRGIGSLRRMELFMLKHGIKAEVASEGLEPLRRIRRARQKPAHALRANINDRTFVHRQIALMRDVNSSLVSIRAWLATHPKNRAWESAYSGVVDHIL